MSYVGVLVCLVALIDAQRTYRRHCECEYAVNGQCAYTLLLPTTPSGEMACPLTNSSDSLGRLQDDVSALQAWTGEQAKAVVTLQNAVNSLTDSGGNGTDSAAMDAVRAAVERLNRTVVELAALCRGRCGDDRPPSDSNATRPSESEAELERRVVGKYRLCVERGLVVSGIRLGDHSFQRQ